MENRNKNSNIYGHNSTPKSSVKQKIDTIKNCREQLKVYYQTDSKALVVSSMQPYNYIGIRASNLSSVGHSGSHRDLSDDELYQTYGTYKTYRDNQGKKVFYNDPKLYNDKKNQLIANFSELTIGFPNIGNSCYMNAFLQILLHTPNFLINLHEYGIANYDDESLIYNLIYLSNYPYNSDYLKNIKKIMGEVNSKYAYLIPGDSQSFAIDLLDTLISDCKGDDPKGDSLDSIYDLNWTKQKCYTEYCKKYHNKKDILEKMFQFTEIVRKTRNHNYDFSINLHVELTFPPNYDDTISITQLLKGKYSTKDVNLDIKPRLSDLPQILIVSFVRGIEGKGVIKTKVSFDEKLILSDYLDSDLASNLKSKYYIFFGVNERYGEYKSQGHYVSFIKINRLWYRFSDLYVTQTNPDFISPDVFGLYYIRNDCIPTTQYYK